MTYFQWEQQQQEGKNRDILLMGAAAAAAGADKGTMRLGCCDVKVFEDHQNSIHSIVIIIVIIINEQVFEDHQDSIHNIAAFANKKFEAFEEFSGQVFFSTNDTKKETVKAG